MSTEAPPTGPKLPDPNVRHRDETSVTLGRRDDHLSYREARQSPCSTCHTSPCCTHLLLSTISLATLLDVDHATYLLNFDGIVLALGSAGTTAQVYLHQSCGFLDVPSGLCTVHMTPVQPAVCIQYSAHSCGYREAFTTDVHPEHPLLDYRRMAWLADQMEFDDARRVVAYPDWDHVLETFRSMPMERRPLPPPAPDPIREEWRSIVLSDKVSEPDDRPWRHYSDAEVSNPCQGCGAWCCQVLVFHRGRPGDASQLEFLRYCLGFPGVELGLTDEAWSVIVRTTCRHFDNGLCGAYGTDARPLKCGYFDAMSCGYRGHFGVARPDDFLRVGREHFAAVANSILFNEVGQVVAIPPVDVLSSRVQELERVGAGLSASPAS